MRDPTPRPSDPLEVANRLRPVLLHLSRPVRRELGTLGVTAGQVSLLAAIHGTPGVGVGELAAREAMSAPAVCGHLDRLEAGGLVARERATGGDRRRVGLTVTEAGEEVLRAARTRRTAWLAERLRRVPDDDLELIDRAATALRRLLDEAQP